MSENEKSVFATLNSIDVSGKTEKKNGLTYLSWSWAWGEIKKKYPDTTYKVYESADGRNYHTDGRTCWVKCSVTCQGIENIEYLPVMDYRNISIVADKVTSMDVNKSIQRCVTKAIARHGLGLYIYAGEDLPEEMGVQAQARSQPQQGPVPHPATAPAQAPAPATAQAPAPALATPEQCQKLRELFPEDRINKLMELLGITALEQLPADKANGYIAVELRKRERAAQANGRQ